jgi:putative membrane protein
MRLLFKKTNLKAQTEEVKPKIKNPSRIRDHLANERTYLAWMRTAIALIGFGVVILRLRYFHPPLLPRTGMSWKLGLLFSLIGLMTVLLSIQHYFAVRHDIDEDTYEPGDRWVLLFSISVMILGAGVVYFVFLDSINQTGLFAPE